MSRLCEFIIPKGPDKRMSVCGLPAMHTATVINQKRQQVKVLCCVDCYDKVRSGQTPKLPPER